MKNLATGQWLFHQHPSSILHPRRNASVMGANELVGAARCADRTPQRGVPTTQDGRITPRTIFPLADILT